MMHSRINQILAYLLALLLVIIGGPFMVHGEVPRQINYQGHLTNDAGDPVQGDVEMTFSIYDVLAGGTALWWEQQTVLVVNGIYNVQIGQDLIGNPFPGNLFEGQRWLGVAVEADTEMTPRQLLTCAPFAMRAEVAEKVVDGTVDTVHIADSAVTTDKVEDDAITSTKIYDGTITHFDLLDGAVMAEILDDDGDGSQLDADRLDGLDADAFALSGHFHYSLDAADGNPTDALFIDNSGKVGVGTMNPNVELDVRGRLTASTTVGPHLIIHDSNYSNDRPGIQFTNNNIHYVAGDDGSNEFFGLYAGYDSSRTFDAHWRVHGKSDSNWGTYIGMTHDGTDGKIETDVGNIIFEPAGNVGLGVTSPSEKLEVAGNLKVTGTGNGMVFSDGTKQTTAYVATLESRVAILENEVAQLKALLLNVTRKDNDIYFNGVNVHINNNTDSTDGAVNSLGNLIVGYNEARSTGNLRTGSHNIIVGRQHNYSSYGSLIAGETNTASGIYASVTGGVGNTASGPYASVSGGGGNTAGGQVASVSGGTLNEASGNYASVSGGEDNTASGLRSSVSGGYQNIASYEDTWVGGGVSNTASSTYASVSGGRENISDGYATSVSGGRFNLAFGDYSSIAGGGGEASGDGNRAYGNYSAVLGGRDNETGATGTALGLQATISGGAGSDAKGTAASVSGGYINHADGSHASISGGRYSTASGNYASVSGGRGHTASGDESSVSGGEGNIASGLRASVTGGELNQATYGYASVTGGLENRAEEFWTTVSGGYQRSVDHQLDWRGGDLWSDQ